VIDPLLRFFGRSRGYFARHAWCKCRRRRLGGGHPTRTTADSEQRETEEKNGASHPGIFGERRALRNFSHTAHGRRPRILHKTLLG
jgi:hypothetical protein